MTRFGTTTFQVSMNGERWQGLPDDIKKAFADASGPDWWAKVGDVWRATDNFGINLAVKSGNTHITLTAAETAKFDTALAPVVDRWIAEVSKKGIDGQALVEQARALIVKHAQ